MKAYASFNWGIFCPVCGNVMFAPLERQQTHLILQCTDLACEFIGKKFRMDLPQVDLEEVKEK